MRHIHDWQPAEDEFGYDLARCRICGEDVHSGTSALCIVLTERDALAARSTELEALVRGLSGLRLYRIRDGMGMCTVCAWGCAPVGQPIPHRDTCPKGLADAWVRTHGSGT